MLNLLSVAFLYIKIANNVQSSGAKSALFGFEDAGKAEVRKTAANKISSIILAAVLVIL